MAIRSYYRGHPIIFRGRRWYFDEGKQDMRVVDNHKIPCALCGEPPTPEGHDACLGHIEGAQFACCGHGVHDGYIKWRKREG